MLKMASKHTNIATESGINEFFDEKFYSELLPNLSSDNVTMKFVNKIVEKVMHFLEKSYDRNEKIVNFVSPGELMKLIDFRLPDSKTSLGEILNNVDLILKHVIKTAHPRCFNQLWAGIDINCMMGDWITSATNTTMYTFEMAPVYVLMEKFILEKIFDIVGYKDNEGDGFFFPGGSLCNMEAIVLARHKKYPLFKKTGMYGGKRLVLFASEEGHYSIKKAAAMLGLGSDNVILIKTDNEGKMILSDLHYKIEASISNGAEPFFVCATAGTTVGGAFDLFNEIADICEKYGIWMHIDGCWGGSCLLSQKYRHLMDGSSRANSIAWDPHKMLTVMQQCSFLLTKEKGLFHEHNSLNATYLFQKDKKLYDVSWDNGDLTFQCGRHNDVLKLWLMWKAKGTSGIEEVVDHCFKNAIYLADEVKKRNDFKLIREPSCGNVCFWYIPPSLMSIDNDKERSKKLSEICPIIKERMTLEGSLMVSYQPLNKHCNFFRMITSNPASTPADMDFVLDEIKRLGCDL